MKIEMESRKEERKKLVFALNGERVELSNIEETSITLLEFLRTKTHYKGAKLGCGEGGCGACVVLLSRYDPKKEEVEDYSISSCLTLLCSINGCSITTTEGLGNSRDGLHPIHQRFAGFHATQCGFCTPGMCMSLFSALVNADKAAKSSPPPPAADGFSNITCSEAEKAIAGNLCRCTGYRPIADVCKSFAADVDIEDLGFNSFWTKGANADAKKLPLYGRDGGICTFPDFLKDEIKSSMDVISDSPMATKSSDGIEDAKLEIPGKWYSPESIDELQNLLEFEVEKNGNRVKLVTGNTGAGIYKMDYYDKYIDLRNIPELSVITRESTGIEIGAAVSISKAIGALREEIKGGPPGLKETMVFTKIADHMNKVASQFVRNTASVGGNIIMAQRNSFPSDIATILLAAGSSVNIHSGSEVKSLTLEAFLQMPPCNSRTLLLSIRIPTWNSPRNPTSGSKLLFETYRASPRPLGNASAYINAAFLAFVSPQKMSESFVLENLRLVFGAYGTKHAIRAKKVEEFLSGKSITPALLLGAIRLLRETIEPAEGTPNAAYRSSLAVGFLFDVLRPFVKGLAEPIDNIQMKNCHVANGTEAHNGGLNGYSNGLTNGLLENGCLHDRKYHPESANSLLSSKQTIEISKEYKPVGLPTKKVGAELQASGEALYVDDIPSPQDCLYGAFIYGTRPLARVKGIRFTSASASERIIKVISVKDIPQGGNNIGSMSMFAGEPLFADDITQWPGEPLGFVVAETQRHANMAANQVAVDYDIENLEPPILTVEEAVDRSSFFEVASLFNPKPVGDFSKGMAEAEHKIVSAKIELGSQYYFYMETQTALAVPDEDNCMVVYTSTQIPEMAQRVIARCLGIPDHNVRVITRRVGGAFGGKFGRSLPVAAACALAAYKLRRPVRSYLDRKTDMIMAGGRHPMKINYTVGFKSDGKITALHINLLLNAGISEDVSPIIPYCIVDSLKTYNWGALSFDFKVCKLNHSSKSAMRGPGQLQASYIAETVIEHVASFLSMEPDPVRKKNLHSFESLKLFYGHISGESTAYTLPSIWDRLATSASFHQRTEMVKQFNVRNKWRKRGISRVPCVYGVLTTPIPGKVSVLNDGSIVVEVGGIELGQGLWTKVKQVTAFALAQLWTNGSQDLLERVRVVQADTLSLVQGGWTMSSTTSEASCEASRIACNILVERLMPLKERLEEQMGAISWDTLILQANLQAVNLSAHTLWNPDASTKEYLNFGATVSEVEIDLLTGATTILRTDIVYDCGKSLNPAVDLGQIEGSFVQGIGFYMLEEYLTNSSGLVISEGPRTYTVPTIDTIPKEFNVELHNSGHHAKRVLSSKACGEPPLLMAVSIHCAVRQAIKEARKELLSNGIDQPLPMFEMKVPATMPVVKELCGLDNVEKYLETLISHQ